MRDFVRSLEFPQSSGHNFDIMVGLGNKKKAFGGSLRDKTPVLPIPKGRVVRKGEKQGERNKKTQSMIKTQSRRAKEIASTEFSTHMEEVLNIETENLMPEHDEQLQKRFKSLESQHKALGEIKSRRIGDLSGCAQELIQSMQKEINSLDRIDEKDLTTFSNDLEKSLKKLCQQSKR